MVPFFLPVIAGLIARGAAVVGRMAIGAGRAIASSGGGRIVQGIGKAAQRAGVAIQKGAAGGFGRAGGSQGGGLGGGGLGGGRRRPVTPGRARGRRRRARRQVSFGQAFTRSVRRGARAAITRQRSGSGSKFIQKLFNPQSFLGRITQNYGSAQANFKQGNTVDGVVDSLKVVGDVAKPLAKALATVTLGASGAALAIAAFPKLMKEWGAAIIESKRNLGEFNATYAIALGRLDIARFRRNVQLSAATGGSFRNLTQTQNRLEEKLLPYQIMATNSLFKVVDLLQQIAVAGVQTAERAADFVPLLMIARAFSQKFGLNGNGGKPDNNPLADLAGALGRGNFQRRVRPPMPGGPNAGVGGMGGAAGV